MPWRMLESEPRPDATPTDPSTEPLDAYSAAVVGAVATVVYAHVKHWTTVIPTEAWAGGFAASLIIGAVAGLIPAIRAARLSPTQPLWSV